MKWNERYLTNPGFFIFLICSPFYYSKSVHYSKSICEYCTHNYLANWVLFFFPFLYKDMHKVFWVLSELLLVLDHVLHNQFQWPFLFLSKINNRSQQKLSKWFGTMFNQQLIAHFPLFLLLFLFSPHNNYSNKKKYKMIRNMFSDEPIEYLPFEFLEAEKV